MNLKHVGGHETGRQTPSEAMSGGREKYEKMWTTVEKDGGTALV